MDVMSSACVCCSETDYVCAHVWGECVRRSAWFCEPRLELEESSPRCSSIRGGQWHQFAAFACWKTRLIDSCWGVGFGKGLMDGVMDGGGRLRSSEVRLMDARSGPHVSIDEQRWRDPVSKHMYTSIDFCR